MEYNNYDVETLAKTLYGEARGEPHDGKVAVAWVIRNRAARGAFAGNGVGKDSAVARVCMAPWQFSCWNADDPNRTLLLTLQRDRYVDEFDIATDVLDGLVEDNTKGADHYHTIARPRWADNWPPAWAPTMGITAKFGGHIFYSSLTKPAAILRIGITSLKVKELQQKLLSLGYDLGPTHADGQFGTLTYNAVCAYQRSKGLVIDGVVGTTTAAKLGVTL